MEKIFSKSYLIKSIITILIILVGVTGGVYVGYSIVLSKKQAYPTSPYKTINDLLPEEIRLTIEEGDLFPLEDYNDLNGTKNNFENLIMGVNSLIIFASPECEPCDNFYYQISLINNKINDDVQVVTCLPKGVTIQREDYPGIIVFIDTELFVDKYNLYAYPTLIGVDKYGIIVHIQYHSKEYIDREIIKEFTSIET